MRINELPVFVTNKDTSNQLMTDSINMRFRGFLASLARRKHLKFEDLCHEAKLILDAAEIPQNVFTETIDSEDDICASIFDMLAL